MLACQTEFGGTIARRPKQRFISEEPETVGKSSNGVVLRRLGERGEGIQQAFVAKHGIAPGHHASRH
jgi:hypothetical protein